MVSHYKLGQGHSWWPCQGPLPQVAVSLTEGGILLPHPGHGVRCGALICPGGSPYCWCSVFEVQGICYVLIVEDIYIDF